MINERKEKLLKHLYPTQEIREFMCNDLYQELLQVISKSTCISSKNIVEKIRKLNYEKVKFQIKQFLSNNIIYLNKIKSFAFTINLEDIITGLVFYISLIDETYTHIDIFKDKKSICYSSISIVDIM